MSELELYEKSIKVSYKLKSTGEVFYCYAYAQGS